MSALEMILIAAILVAGFCAAFCPVSRFLAWRRRRAGRS
jgi:hypothetical protein